MLLRRIVLPGRRCASTLLTMDSTNPQVKEMEYAVRGPLVIRAVQLEKELKAGQKKPFTQVIKANIGDAHAMGQTPITFIRQVVACVTYPKLLKSLDFPNDVKERAKEILENCGGGSIGAYTMSDGIEYIRKHIAGYIKRRDGIPADPNTLVLGSGASEVIKTFMNMFNVRGGKPTGVLIPIPQYPLYSATITEFSMSPVGYYLDEDNKWALDISELKRAVDEGRKTSNPRILVVINPGNPTGQVLAKANIESIVKFAHSEELFIFADEVYQDNVYDRKSAFHSFKRVMTEMGQPYSDMGLASFHSVSKGYMGECGMRGGYGEIVNIDPDVMAMYRKSLSAKLCSTVTGQVVMDLVARPPAPGEESHELWAKEKAAVLRGLAERARMIHELFGKIDGVSCNPLQGAMYAFPRLDLPQKYIQLAESEGVAPDFRYAMDLLMATGICVVPGSGFGQRPGTHHFRTTILPQPQQLTEMLQKFEKYHVKFLKQYQ